MSIKTGIVDDHLLFLKSFSFMISGFKDFEVVLEAMNGKALQEKLKAQQELPDIILIDVNMPVMDGAATAKWISTHFPQIKLVALSMNDSDVSIISMMTSGCCCYLLKDTSADEFEKALRDVYTKGFYNSDAGIKNNIRLLLTDHSSPALDLSQAELQFLQYACSESTYKEIAVKMNISERTVESYREKLFAKFKVRSRVGLALEAIKRELVVI